LRYDDAIHGAMQLAGTSEKLVEKLADEYDFNETYAREFLLTYRSIMSMYKGHDCCWAPMCEIL
jgi:hypothetical protein